MDKALAQLLSDAIAQESQAHIRNLVAAEEAVSQGRFNIAKVMRAAAHASRARAMNLQRLLAEQTTAEDLNDQVETQRAHHEAWARHLDSLLTTLAHQQGRGLTVHLETALSSRRSLLDVLSKSSQSLKSHRDVMESDVAQTLWGCHECGYIAEENLPDACPLCGALAAEFERFGPFFASTTERLGQRRPEDVRASLGTIADEIAQAFQGLPEEALRRRPSPTEWCIKEIAGHIMDIHELFTRRVHLLMGASPLPSMDTPVPPWRILEGRGYPEMPAGELLARLRTVAGETLSLVNQLAPKDWTARGTLRSQALSALDLGTWLTNHNKGHLVQVQELRQRWLEG